MEYCQECDWTVPTWRALQVHRYIKHGLVAQGKTLEDGTYIWTCNKCEDNPNCDWCYGLDTTRIIEEMTKGARGQRYYALLKAFLSVKGKAITDEGKRIYAERGGLNTVDMGYISLKFGLNFKATVEWLEETRVMRTGNVYEKVKHFKVKDIYEAARKEYGLSE